MTNDVRRRQVIPAEPGNRIAMLVIGEDGKGQLSFSPIIAWELLILEPWAGDRSRQFDPSIVQVEPITVGGCMNGIANKWMIQCSDGFFEHGDGTKFGPTEVADVIEYLYGALRDDPSLAPMLGVPAEKNS